MPKKRGIVRGQVVRVTTMADECVRLTIDIDSALIPEDLNLIHWKHGMVNVALVGEADRDEFFG
jgi:hypothetical protein